MKRPHIEDAWKSFQEVYTDIGKTVPAVGTKIGGKVDYNINKIPQGQGRFENACAIRMSYVLNENGIKIPYISGKNGFRCAGSLVHLQGENNDHLPEKDLWRARAYF